MSAPLTASALDLIGNTPLIALDRAYPGPGRVLAKAEFLNPGGSVKDRAGKAVVERLRASGALTDGQPVVAMTSGNFGAGLAVVGAVLGHPVIAVMSAGNSPERARMLEALGAEVVLAPQADGAPRQVTGADIAAADRLAAEIARDRGALLIDQFTDPASVAAHCATTGPEIFDQTGGRIDAFVAAVGSGGTFVGTASYLKARRPGVRCIAVEPLRCRPLAGEVVTKPRHVLQGAGYGFTPPHWRAALMDDAAAVSDAEASDWRQRLAAREGLHVGYTAAANVCVATRAAEKLGPGSVVVTILCDSGLKYG